ncbi:MAG: hypothetical protein J5U16_05980 [Candidatus Methanoperedens sp.]|nr:hypothetical protein [Candidatus Methanoperedens sp.]
MSTGIIWFSHREEIFEVKNGKFSWTGEDKIWDWDNCTVSFVRTAEDIVKIIVRSTANINSTYMGKKLFTWEKIPEDEREKKELISFLKDDYDIDRVGKITKEMGDRIIINPEDDKRIEILLDENNEKAILRLNKVPAKDLQIKVENDIIDVYRGKPVELRYMLGFDINVKNIREPNTECYVVRNPGRKEGPNLRWVFQMDKDHWIWEWAKEGESIETSNIFRFYKNITKQISSLPGKRNNIFDVKVDEQDDRIIPVIYQPAVDGLDNFIREVHCKQTQKDNGNIEVKVTLVFNNEQLRKHFLVNKIYEWLREHILFGRKKDIESFVIFVEKDPVKFTFENIYNKINRKEYNMEDDNIHGDKNDAPKHDIKYYFMDYRHPIVFVNTSNHAMAENDANHRLWKWEYVPWLKNSAVKLEMRPENK